MPTKLKPDWRPSNNVADLMANRFGIRQERAREFIGHELPHFILYFTDTGKAKDSWESTCYNWMCRAYEDKKEQMARDRADAPKTGDIFEAALDMVADAKAGLKPPEPRRRARIVHTPIPGEGQTMSAEDALKQLRGNRRV